ncbi:MAG: GNAT family N-acetyltransferase [Candidatus Delongbacteria bacterium]|nr:GNAT family N-acetyltransferase [Candidatus Delongbacteria bacterium]
MPLAESDSKSLEIRPAVRSDLPVIMSLIRELAEYEQMEDQVSADVATLEQSLFGPVPSARVILAWYGGIPVGSAVYFYNFSTFIGRPGLYLEDLFVRPQYRKLGIGKALLLYLVDEALRLKCGRMEWSVLTWNQPAIDFYRSLGAVALEEWRIFRLSLAAMQALVRRSVPE